MFELYRFNCSYNANLTLIVYAHKFHVSIPMDQFQINLRHLDHDNLSDDHRVTDNPDLVELVVRYYKQFNIYVMEYAKVLHLFIDYANTHCQSMHILFYMDYFETSAK